MVEMHGADYQELSLEETVKLLGTELQDGLALAEVERRQKEFGHNEVPEKKTSPVVRLAKKFWGLTPWMLELTIVLSWLLQKYLDMYIIAALLALNAVLGFAQEQRASRAVEMLKQKLHVNARVLRAGKWSLVPALELVPGDVVRVRAGDFVPADLKIVQGELQVDQSSLTGESLAIAKKRNDVLFSSSIVKRGEATAVTVLTGVHTYYGKTTELVQSAAPRLHTEEVISQIVTGLLAIVAVFLAPTIAMSLMRGVSLLQVLTLALVLLVSAIPVALPAMFTIAMAVGSMDLVKRGVLITRLSASEDAASMDTLCADKTGTITENKLSINRLLPLGNFTADDIVLYGALASQAANHDPIDLAFLGAMQERKIPVDGNHQEQFVPFDPATRRTEATIAQGDRKFRVIKGAVSTVAQLVGLTTEESAALEDQMHVDALGGAKTLAIAVAQDDSAPKLVGLAGLADSPRPDSLSLIRELKALGVAVKMLTGDALSIAKETAKQVGLGSSIATAAELKQALSADGPKVGDLAEGCDVFAEIYPQDKYAIVKSLQARGHIVGMTGDGVNDAPALKQAEVGIAVRNATDVAKGAASVVLNNEGLGNIVDLVRVGRMIHQRITTWILNKIIKTFLIVVFVSIAFLITGRYIVSAFDIVLLLFLVDFVTLSLATDKVRWSNQPDRWDLRALIRPALVLGVLAVVESLGILGIGMNLLGLSSNSAELHTFSFAILFYTGLFTIFVVRERGHFWESRPSTPLLLFVLLDMLVGAALVTLGMPELQALPVPDTLVVVGLSFLFSLIVNDWVKYIIMAREQDARLPRMQGHNVSHRQNGATRQPFVVREVETRAALAPVHNANARRREGEMMAE